MFHDDYAATAKEAVKFRKIAETTLDKAFYQKKFRRYTEVLACIGQLFQEGGAE
jgi:hypothetical protein